MGVREEEREERQRVKANRREEGSRRSGRQRREPGIPLHNGSHSILYYIGFALGLNPDFTDGFSGRRRVLFHALNPPCLSPLIACVLEIAAKCMCSESASAL